MCDYKTLEMVKGMNLPTGHHIETPPQTFFKVGVPQLSFMQVDKVCGLAGVMQRHMHHMGNRNIHMYIFNLAMPGIRTK